VAFIRKPKCFWLETATPQAEEGIRLCMTKKREMSALFLGAALLCGSVVPGGASNLHQAQDNRPRRQDMKDAGHEARKTLRRMQRTAQNRERKRPTTRPKRGTKKAWHKTKETSKGAVNGAKEGAKQPGNRGAVECGTWLGACPGPDLVLVRE